MKTKPKVIVRIRRLEKRSALFPELVEALELAYDCRGHTQPDKGSWTDQVMNKTKSILSKARGKQ